MAIIQNKKARFDYEIEEKFEAGLELRGWEVKYQMFVLQNHLCENDSRLDFLCQTVRYTPVAL